jgi:phosphoribosyl 1,2-cyclic phosphate phosphodiesterase
MQLVFLGSGDEHGVPRIGCDCETCQQAQAQDSRNCRTSSSVAIRYGQFYSERVILIDAAPEFRLQTTNLGLGQFDAVLLTHAHDAHILGLSALASAQREAGLPLGVYAPSEVLDDVRERFGNLWTDRTYRRVWQPQAIEGTVDLWGLEASPFRVDHGVGGIAYGYLLIFDDLRVGYVSDMLRATTQVREMLQDLDLLVLGASHYYEGIDIWKRSVMDIVAAVELIGETAPGRAILTQLSHTVDHEEISAGLPPEVSLAYDGLEVEVGT